MVVALALLAACTSRSEPEAGSPPSRSGSPRVAQPPSEQAHAVSESPSELVLEGLATEPTALAIAVADEATLIVAEAGAHRYRVVQRDGMTRIARDVVASAGRLRFASRFGSGFLIASLAAAEGGTEWVFERFDGATGAALGLVRSPVAESVTTLRRASHGARVLVAHSDDDSPVRALVCALAGEQLVVRSLAIRDPADELSRELVGAALLDDAPAVLFRRGVPEDPRGGLFLVSERGTHELEPLHELGLLERLERTRDQVLVVGSFEFDRPIAFRFGPDGRMLEMQRLTPGERPSWLEPRNRADVEADDGTVVIRIRDSGGDVLRSVDVTTRAGAAPPAVTRRVHEFVVATSERAGEGFGVRVHHVADEVLPR